MQQKTTNTNPSSTKLPGLAGKLVKDNVITQTIAEEAIEESTKQNKTFVQYLVAKKLAKSRDIALIASSEFGVPLVDLEAMEISEELANLVSKKLQEKHRTVPLFKRGNRLFLAVSDPSDHRGMSEIAFSVKLTTQLILVEESKLSNVLDKGQDDQKTNFRDVTNDELLGEIQYFSDDEDGKPAKDDAVSEDAPIVRYINKILVDAITSGASDIHIEPYEKYIRIRYRQDGMLNEIAQQPPNLAGRLSARLKVMSRMNIAERRVPQDGKIRLKLSAKRDVDFRVNTMPTLYGEKVVLRILDATTAKAGIDKLGFDETQMAAFLKAIKRPYGLLLVTGPTGSGKTVSLYSALNILNEPHVNISTAEDPVEIQVPGINQVNVAGKMTFADALKAFLRQDPDVIMVGEIRDLETASIAVKAAQTGHMVLSTLHTNDAPQTLTRLANMGVPPFNIASAVLLIMAQRLARRLCENCKEQDDIPPNILLQEGFTEEDLRDIRNGDATLYKPVGCPNCKRGYKGRVGLFQVMPISEAMARIIMQGGNSYQLADQAALDGVKTMRQSGIAKVKAGITSLEELNRVTKE
jgi:type IV pilus assembly protein PilB